MNSKTTSSEVPVALFAYARPQHLQKCLASLRKNRVRLMYAFSDGARAPEQEPLVQEVRQILHQVDWCDIHITEREKNWGLGASIRSGVTEVLKQHDRVMVVEDDILLRPGAYAYTAAALEHYENAREVLTISMWSHPSLVPRGASSGFFSKRFVCWGWATYRRAWETYTGTPLEVYQRCVDAGLDVLAWGQDLKWQAEHAAEKNLWYVGYALTHFIQNGVSYFPVESLTANIGFDGSGENTGGGNLHADKTFTPVSLPEIWTGISLPPDIQDKFANYFKPKKNTLIKRVRNYLGMQVRKLLGSRVVAGTDK